MKALQHVLISLEERHANNILAGSKQVELRRRTMHVEPGSIVWFYVKKPRGAVVGYAYVEETYAATPSALWRRFGPVSGLSKGEFMTYFDGLDAASAIVLSDPTQLKQQVELDELRINAPGFQPPQFYCKLEKRSAIETLLLSASAKTSAKRASVAKPIQLSLAHA